MRRNNRSTPARAEISNRAGLRSDTVARVRVPSWRDPRLLAGVVLVVASMVLGGRVVAGADDTLPYYVAAHPLTAGDPVTSQDVRVVHLRLAEADEHYLAADRPLPSDLVARDGVGAGELIPLGGIGSAADLAVTPVGIPVATTLPSAVRKGAPVDIWVASADPQRAGAFLSPTLQVRGATVAEIQQSSGALGSAGGATVQVLVDSGQIPGLLEALANKSVVSVVPSGVPG